MRACNWISILPILVLPLYLSGQQDPVDWSAMNILDKENSVPMTGTDVWQKMDLTSPDSKITKGKFPWLVLTPAAVIPAVLLIDKKEESVDPPLVTCSNISLDCDQPLPAPDPADVNVTIYCDKGEVVIEHAGDVSNGGSGCSGSPLIVTRTYRITDACDNVVLCVQDFVYHTDQVAPVIQCPPNVTLECNGTLPPPDPASVQASDDCTAPDQIDVVFVSDEHNGGTGCSDSPIVVTRAYMATDACGNTAICAQIFTFNPDVEAPVIDCPADLTLSCGDALPPPDITSLTAADNCTPVEQISIVHLGDEQSGVTGCPGDQIIVTRTYQATDGCGNIAVCGQVLAYEADQQAPVVSTPATDITVHCDGSGNTAELTHWLDTHGGAVAADACSEVTWTNDFQGIQPDCGSTGFVNVTFTVTDACGNSAMTSAIFKIQDVTAPDISCPPDITISCEDDTGPVETGMATASDICTTDPEIDFDDDASGLSGCAGTGVLIRTFTATDACGNTASCVQLITVVDITPPVLACPVDVSVFCGESTDPSVTGLPLVEENCGTYTIQFDDVVTGDCPGTIERLFIVTDECGNASSCGQMITVISIECEFGSVVDITGATCLNPNGGATITITLPGDFDISWSNGSTGTEITDVPPGEYAATIIDNTIACAEIILVTIPSIPYPLDIISISQPTAPGANDGSVILQIPDPDATLPFNVFVDGTLIGQANTSTFTIEGFGPGIYEIFIIDNGGNGCASIHLFIEFMIGPGIKDLVEISSAIIESGSAHILSMAQDAHTQYLLGDEIFETLDQYQVEHPCWKIVEAPRYMNTQYVGGMISLTSGITEVRLGIGIVTGSGFGNVTSRDGPGTLQLMPFISDFSAAMVQPSIRMDLIRQSVKRLPRVFVSAGVTANQMTISRTMVYNDQNFAGLSVGKISLPGVQPGIQWSEFLSVGMSKDITGYVEVSLVTYVQVQSDLRHGEFRLQLPPVMHCEVVLRL